MDFKALAFFKSSKVILKAPGVFAIPTHLFALSSAFLGVAVWENFNHHFDAVSKEGEALVAYVNYVESVPSIRDSNLISSAQAYVKSATNEEWKMIATDKRRDPNTDLLMRDLISKTLLAASNPNLSNPIASGLIQAVQGINTSRNARLGMIYIGRPHPLQWYCVLLLGFMVQISLLANYAENPSQSKSSLAIGTISMLIVLSLIGLSVNPYTGSISISNSPLKVILTQ